MIIVNGSIQIKQKTGGGLDSDGNPVRVSESFSDPIPCHLRANKLDNLGRQDGNTFTVAAYEALVESADFAGERVRLTGGDGRELGEFSVMSVESLDAVGALKVMV